MEEILIKIAQDSAIASVAIFTIWRMSIVMNNLANALVVVSTANAETLSEAVEHPK